MDAGDELERRRERDTVRGLWPIGWALTVAGVAALTGLAAVTVVALAVLGFPSLAAHESLTVGDLLEMLKLVLGTVAGGGALAALVMNYRKQRLAEVSDAREQQHAEREQQRANDDRVRVFNERFATAAGQLGHAEPAVRLAGVHAMAGLADDWTDGQQTCIDVLCAYLRVPYGPRPGSDAPAADLLAYSSIQEVRRTTNSIITAHLRNSARVSWQGRTFDFAGVHLDAADFSYAVFSGGRVDFSGAVFPSGTANFRGATFSGGFVDFSRAHFSGGTVDFSLAKFCGGVVYFDDAKLSAGTLAFDHAKFTAETGSVLHGVRFNSTVFVGGTVNFAYAEFSSGGTVWFDRTDFSGSRVDFRLAKFSGGTVNFYAPVRWSTPPVFDSGVTADPPPGLKLPQKG